MRRKPLRKAKRRPRKRSFAPILSIRFNGTDDVTRRGLPGGFFFAMDQTPYTSRLAGITA
ncbi:MAG: hypothetical protein EPN57_10130 [Paraburkholderia sp.]|nr:MAG: hypothetical protein EPN57_10130 [Paraburkholderia sp.]